MSTHAFEGLFWGNRKLKNHNEKVLYLPATTLVEGCYDSMFLRCSSLNSITCLATEISEYAFSGECLDGVASSGTFICPSSMKAYWTNKLSSGDIPPNWTIEDYTVQ